MSVRREIRLRKEYLLKKQKDSQEITVTEKKRKLKAALDEGKSVPTEIIGEARKLHHDMELDLPTDGSIDDEYANANQREPKICITTSRDPSSRLKQFAKEIRLCFPNSQVINRGNHRVDELMEACKKADFSDVIVINETRGNPDALVVSHLPFGPTAYFTLSNCVLRHDIPECKPASQMYPQLILDSMQTTLGKRIGRIIQSLYPIPKPDSKRVITFANRDDFISFRHHMYTKVEGKVELQEAGPRFEMMPYEIRLGTMDSETAEKEWVLRPYMNSSRKKQNL